MIESITYYHEYITIILIYSCYYWYGYDINYFVKIKLSVKRPHKLPVFILCELDASKSSTNKNYFKNIVGI